ncbi:uncharacterized protein LOC143051148 [Mytilus galloprovincialis]|uniref:uncharacterized protein LOC143051148 n=1 Tax=Mytilus galloprovincialis TaxID=29158 RepID=UPI003F7CBC3F
MHYLIYLRTIGLIFCHIYVVNSKCHHGYKVCDIEEWAPWSFCSATCGGGEQIRKKYMCCDDTVKPKTLQNCLDHCNLTISWYESNAEEKRHCGFHCMHGKYNRKEHQCKCESEYSGVCCEKASPSTKFIQRTKTMTTTLVPRTKLSATATLKQTTTATATMTTTKVTTRPTTTSTTKLTTTPLAQPTTRLKIPTTKSKTLFTPLSTKSTSALTTVRHLKKVTFPKNRFILSTIKSIPPRTTSTSNPKNALKKQTASITNLLPSHTISKFVKFKTVVNLQLKPTSIRPKALKTSVRKHGFSTSKSRLFMRATTAKPIQSRSSDVNMFISTKAQLGIHLGTKTQRSHGRTAEVSDVSLVKTTIPPAHLANHGQRTTFSKQTNIFEGHQTIVNGGLSKTNILTYNPHNNRGNHGTKNISYNSPNGNGNMNMMSSCLGDPCQHGTCLPMSNRYLCFCDPGYEGKNCQINTDECENDPCQYGQCIDRVNDFHCDCNILFKEKRCTKLKTWAVILISLSALTLCLTGCCCFWCISICTKKEGVKRKIEPEEPLPQKPRPSPIGKPNAWLS